jgi:hypothetical protein
LTLTTYWNNDSHQSQSTDKQARANRSSMPHVVIPFYLMGPVPAIVRQQFRIRKLPN